MIIILAYMICTLKKENHPRTRTSTSILIYGVASPSHPRASTVCASERINKRISSFRLFQFSSSERLR